MTASNAKLYQAFDLYDLKLNNRIVMAPLTRCRAGAGDCPRALNALYYQQRASAGLIISEATQISSQGKGYMHTPGIYSNEQVDGWRLVTDAVHQAQGKIFCQLWHVGRISHPDIQIDQALPVAPSAIKANGYVFTPKGKQDFVLPRALELNEIPGIVADYQHAAQMAKLAGFDGIELHAANGYLLDQFLHSSSNHRQDAYGGSIENRCRLVLEVLEAILQIWPNRRVGIRISPVSSFHDMFDDASFQLYSYLVERLNAYNIAYIHCIEGTTRENRQWQDFDFSTLKKISNTYYMANNMYTQDMAEYAVAHEQADLISFGRPFIANPDLVYRMQHHIALAPEAPMMSWYGGQEKGYTDWPVS